jgi:hypothetical protein
MGPVSIVIDTALICEARETTTQTIPTGTRKRTRIKNSVYEDSGELNSGGFWKNQLRRILKSSTQEDFGRTNSGGFWRTQLKRMLEESTQEDSGEGKPSPFSLTENGTQSLKKNGRKSTEHY